MTLIAIVAAVVICAWCTLLIISDERQRELVLAQATAAHAAAQAALAAAARKAGKSPEPAKRKN